MINKIIAANPRLLVCETGAVLWVLLYICIMYVYAVMYMYVYICVHTTVLTTKFGIFLVTNSLSRLSSESTAILEELI